MTLLRLSLKNFQLYRDFDIELGPGVTTLSGRSGSGKSGALRALRWLATSRPLGDSFVRWGESLTEVAALFGGDEPGVEVTRAKGKGVNAYRWGDDVRDPVGTEVPEPIARILNVGPYNFSGQHDPPLWFLLPAPEVSRELNNVVNLTLIDTSLSNIASVVKKCRSEVEFITKRLDDARRARDDLAWAEEAALALTALEAVEGEAASLRLESSRIVSTAERLSGAEVALANASQACLDAETALAAVEGAATLRSEAVELERSLAQLELAEELAGQVVPDAALLDKAELELKRARELREEAGKIGRLAGRLEEARCAEAAATRSLREAEDALAATRGENCPVCLRPLP